MSVEGLLLTCAILNFVVTAFIYAQVPEFLLRFLAWILARLVYRVRAVDTDLIPRKGPALVICNHVSYVDAIILSASVVRPMRFVMESAIFQLPVFNWIFKGMRAIPVASAAENRAVREAAFGAVAAALREGHVVCIFPEGRLTRDGEMADFRPGLLRILAENPVPVIPIGLSGLWGSMFSYGAHGWTKYLPVRFNSHVHVNVGEPIEPTAVTLERLYNRVLELRGSTR
jgi:1-acyl-sn-glycerol-3-phosphate acyltransferase